MIAKTKKLFYLLFLLTVSVNCFSQNLLTANWKFNTGDTIEWAKQNFVDTDWKIINPRSAWEQQGYTNYDGYAWYRIIFSAPISLQAQAVKYKGLTLNLGTIDDADEIFLNGEKIAAHGKFPPNYITAYNEKRILNLASDKIKWNEPNCIAIRVYDNGGLGGIAGEDMTLLANSALDAVVLKINFVEENRVLINPKKVSIPIEITNNVMDEMQAGKITTNVYNDFGDKVFELTKNINLKANSTENLRFDIGILSAGFYKMTSVLTIPTGEKKQVAWFAINPEKVKAKPDYQKDFLQFWQQAKNDLAAISPNYKLTKLDSLCNGSTNIYLVEMNSLDNLVVRGYLSVPKKAGKYPAVLQTHGYSSSIDPQGMHVVGNMISFGLNIRGHGISADVIKPGFPGYLQYGIDDEKKYIYRGAYMDCRRAIDFLYSLPEVDTTKVMVEGGSQGGALSIATAALNPERIKLSISTVPFLSDFPNYFKVGNWPANEFKDYVKNNPKIGWDKIYKTLSYFDIKNLATLVKCPVYMSVGLFDGVCPPRINFAAFNNVMGEKIYQVSPLDGHAIGGEYINNTWNWAKKKLGVGDK